MQLDTKPPENQYAFRQGLAISWSEKQKFTEYSFAGSNDSINYN